MDVWRQYIEAGISVIPLYPRSKRPHFDRLIQSGYYVEDEDEAGRPIKKAMWLPAVEAIAPEAVLTQWFAGMERGQVGIALIAGAVSGRLIYADFDKADLYRQWALTHKELVNSTAVQKTRNGYHVFFRVADEGSLAGGALYYQDERVGELRGTGMYVAAHPSIHPSGITYTWLRPVDKIALIPSLESVDLSLGQAVQPLSHEPFEPVTVQIADREILRIAGEARNGDLFNRLWAGDTSGYYSASDADLALCNLLAFWLGGDGERIDQLFRASGLYREKWDKPHRRDGATYGQMTIEKAQAGLQSVYRPRQVTLQGEQIRVDWSGKYGRKWRNI